MIEEDLHITSVGPEDVARILDAMGQLMDQLHERDLALQDAVSDMTAKCSDMVDLQHIDRVTQTHADLARFLPQLAECLVGRAIDHGSLAGALTLHSLQYLLLGLAADADVEFQVEPGELALF